MLIKSLEQMEDVVRKNNNLSWIGWDVVDRKQAANGLMSPNSVLVNGKWYIQKIYKLDSNGWEMPEKYIR